MGVAGISSCRDPLAVMAMAILAGVQGLALIAVVVGRRGEPYAATNEETG